MTPDAAPFTPDEFEGWLAHPITRWVQGAAKALADDRRVAWLEMSWGAGEANPSALMQLRGQADAHNWLAEIAYSDVCAAMNQDQVADSQ